MHCTAGISLISSPSTCRHPGPCQDCGEHLHLLYRCRHPWPALCLQKGKMVIHQRLYQYYYWGQIRPAILQNPGMDTLWISLGLHPWEIPWSSPAIPWKTLSIPLLLLGLTQSDPCTNVLSVLLGKFARLATMKATVENPRGSVEKMSPKESVEGGDI